MVQLESEITSFLAMLPLPAFVKDKKGKLLYLNARAEKLWKVKAADVLGKTLSEVLGFNDRQVRANDLKVLHYNAAHMSVHVGDAARSPLRSILEFPMMDHEGRRLLGGIMMHGDGWDG